MECAADPTVAVSSPEEAEAAAVSVFLFFVPFQILK
jgi:hypothetical protein